MARKCRLCKGDNLTLDETGVDRYSVPFEYFRCTRCSLIQTFSNAAQCSHYEVVEVYRDRWEFSKVALRLKRSEEHSNVLEVGCGEGHFAEKLHDSACSYVGIDFNEMALVKARTKLGRGDFFCIDLVAYLKNREISFDAFCMFHVIEHLEKPLEILENVRLALGKNGLICLSVPSDKRLSLRLRNRESWDYPPHHLTRWSSCSLEYLASVLNCEILENRVEPLSWGEFKEIAQPYKFTNRLGHGGLRKLLKLMLLPYTFSEYIYARLTSSGQARLIVLQKTVE